MDITPINLDNILEQAPKWTFAGDFTLLQWMNQISKDLETRATKTSEALTKLNHNIRSTNIALDNVANSLTTLQFGNQFVECRVQDDDETNTNENETYSNVQPENTPTSREILNTFLDNNLKVLRNCYEKYSIDLDDSDEEDQGKSKEKTCIYQPINPYNERPLPYIFDSKDWHAKWHVGLYENQQENSYSGDDISEDFSESLSSSHLGDNESFESNTECASSNSIDTEHLNTNIKIKNASSLRGSQSIYPAISTIPINAAKQNTPTTYESSSVSTPSSLVKNSIQPAKQEKYLTKGTENINTTNSYKPTNKILSNNKENTLEYKTQPQTYVDLFAEPPEDIQSITSSTGSSTQNLIRSSAHNSNISTNRALDSSAKPTPPYLDLFAEPPEDISPSATSSSASFSQNIKRKTVNLFDDDNMAKDDVLTVLGKKQELFKPKNDEKITSPPAITSIRDKSLNVSKSCKSLFEDSDEEDDDFLKAFITKSSTNQTTKTSLTNTLFFDNELPESSLNTGLTENIKKNNSTSREKELIETRNIFDNPKDNEDNSNNNKILKDGYETPEAGIDSKLALDAPNENRNDKISVNLFDDFKDISKLDNLETEKKPKNLNLFDDFNDTDGEDLFSAKTKNTNLKNLKSSDIATEKNETKAEQSYSEDISTKSLTSTENSHNNLRMEEKKDNNIREKKHYTKINRINSEVTDNITSAVEHKVPANAKVEDELPSKATLKETNIEKPNTDQKQLDSNVSAEKPIAISTKESQKQMSLGKYDFNSFLFSDEPPEDDDEFFETLTKTPQTTNTNYNVIDLENDIYEPDLPIVPAANTEKNIMIPPESRQTNLYTGLQLFNDVPPDDDGVKNDDDDSSLPTTDVNQTKRLHSVFYDDFSETLMALNQKQIESKIPSQLIFSNEPPSINEELNASSSKDIVDHKVSDIKHKVAEIPSKIEESLSKSVDKFENGSSTKHSVSKLQMPHININVQALLPAGNHTLRKAKEDTKKSQDINQDNNNIKPALIISTGKMKTNEKVDVPRTAETEHILPSVTKNRVKAPAARRPSTRRARQENYRKSLIEEQQILKNDNENNEVLKGNTCVSDNMHTSATVNISKNATIKTNSNTTEYLNPATTEGKVLIDDKNEDNLFKRNKNTTMEIKNETKMLKEAPTKALNSSTSIQNVTNAQNEKKSSDLFENTSSNKETFGKRELKTKISFLFQDEEDDEDDLFKHIQTSQTTNRDDIKATLQSNNSPFVTTETIEEMPKYILVEDNKTTITPDPEPQQPKVNENANKSHVITATTNFKQTEMTPKINQQQSLTNDTKSSFFDTDDEKDYDEGLFKTTTRKSMTSSRYKDNNNKAKANFKSFLDSESDENDVNVAGLQTSNPAKLISTKTSNISATVEKNTSNKLFTDSDSDSDDLFGKSASTKTLKSQKSTETTTKTQIKSQPKSSIFSDESDDDDLNTSAAGFKNKVSTNPLKETKLKANASLFSDIDSDEDDLFGSGAAKVATTIATNISKAKVPSTNKSTVAAVEVSKPKSIADNPLADLL